LIVSREGDRDLAVSQRLLRGRLYREDFAQGQLLRALGVESAVSAEDDIDDVLWILEVMSPRLVTLVVVLLVLSLSSWPSWLNKFFGKKPLVSR
jgi:hypothetical protein